MKKITSKTGNMYVLVQEKDQGELICGFRDGDNFYPFGDKDTIDIVTVDAGTIKGSVADGYLYSVQICPLIGNVRKNINISKGSVDVFTVGIDRMVKVKLDIAGESGQVVQEEQLH